MSEERTTGIVKWASHDKGFGFIDHEGNTYAYMPGSEVQAVGYRNLVEGERVTFVVTQGQQGPQASQVKRVNS